MTLPRRAALPGVLLALALAHPAAAATAADRPFDVPRGYRVTAHTKLANGVEHYRLQSRKPLHVLEVGIVRKGAQYRVDARHAGPRSDGPDRSLEGASQMCGDCKYGTNADYAYRQPSRVVGRPIGGIVERGIVLVSPSRVHQQASYTYDGDFTTERLRWKGRVSGTGLSYPLAGKNVPRGRSRLVLYTSDYVAQTGTNEHGAELTLKLPRGVNNVAPNTVTTATMVAYRYGKGDSKVSRGTVVLSGHGKYAEALRRLWQRGGRGATVELGETLSPANVWASVGGGHILMRNGRRWFKQENAPHLTSAHPRTFAGITKKGDLFHVTVDGRQRNAGRSVGMPLEEALRFFTAFGAREVVNMDGGGSTTFVRRGRVLNRPSDGYERPVTTALVVVRGYIPQQPQLEPVVQYRTTMPELPNPYLGSEPLPVTPLRPITTAVAAGNIVAVGGMSLWLRRRRLGERS